jgi:hypothetical protein
MENHFPELFIELEETIFFSQFIIKMENHFTELFIELEETIFCSQLFS